uniref:Putative secreted protein n=1 Tax=Anopheles darlingi TaxID=43151 RepID=A0A2M4DB22_ANODA
MKCRKRLHHSAGSSVAVVLLVVVEAEVPIGATNTLQYSIKFSSPRVASSFCNSFALSLCTVMPRSSAFGLSRSLRAITALYWATVCDRLARNDSGPSTSRLLTSTLYTFVITPWGR